MHQGRPLSQPPRAQGLCEVTVLVPEGCVEDIRQFAQELRVRQRAGPAETPLRWLALSPSAELMVSPDSSARGCVRDTRAPGADRFRWTVAVLGQLDPIAEGRTETRLEARTLAEAAVTAYFANRAVRQVGVCAVADGRLRQLFWRAADQLDYLVALVRLRILDALAGPLPETPADQQRALDRKRIKRAFPEIER